MNDREVRIYEMLSRVTNYNASVSAFFQPDSIAAKLFEIVRLAKEEMSKFAATESSSEGIRRLSTANKSILREELRDRLLTISRTARAFETDLAGLENKFRVPTNLNDQSLLSTARSFAAEVAPLVTEFIRYEMPADFLEELQELIDLFEKAVIEQETGIKNRMLASSGIDEVVERAIDAVKRVNPIIKNKFRDDPTMLEVWDRARRIQRSPRSAPVDETPAPAGSGD
jgi:hypothetical protein